MVCTGLSALVVTALFSATPAPLLVPAWDTLVAGRNVIVLEPGFQHVRAIDPVTKRKVWHTRVRKDKPNGRHGLLTLRGGKLLFLHAGNQLFRIDPQTGKVLGRLSTNFNRGCALQDRSGLQAWRCRSALSFLDVERLEDLHTIRRSSMHFYGDIGGGGGGDPSEHSTVYSRARDTVVGMSKGGAMVAVIENLARGAKPETMALAGLKRPGSLDRWRSTTLVSKKWVAVGLTADRARGYFANDDREDAGMFDAETGAVLWRDGTAKVATGPRPPFHAAWLGIKRGLFVHTRGKARLLSARGTVVWSRVIPDKALAAPAGTSLERWRWSYPVETRVVWLLDPSTGKVGGRLKALKNDQIISELDRPNGGYSIIGGGGRQLTEHSRSGKQLRTRKLPSQVSDVLPTTLLGPAGVLDRETLAARGSWPTNAHVRGEVRGVVVGHRQLKNDAIGHAILAGPWP